MTELPPTPGQTVGPFFAFGLEYGAGPHLVSADHPRVVRLRGRVLDGAGDPVPDALLEIWQADADGRVPQRAGSIRREPDTFTGFGRCGTDVDGHWAFTTIEPGSVGGGAAFFAVTLFARGLLHRLHTRIYLPDRPELADDPLLASLPADRRESLVARRDGTDLVHDLRLQGEAETVFLRHPGHRD
jgi:protocatechuate 3,4-dioxygenase, alpha subunit